MISTLTLPRGLLCAFLLLACSSVEATSISYPLSPRNNLGRIIVYQAKNLSVTNTPINTVQPVCEVLKKKNVTAYSYKQWHYAGIAVKVCIWAASALGVIFLTLAFSKGMSFFLWLLFFFSQSALNHDPGSAFVKFVLPNLLVGGIILTKDFPKARKAVAGVCLAVLVVSLGAIGLINLNGFSYVDDYSYPEYLVSSTSTNRVIIHEKMELPYGSKYGKQILFRYGGIRTVRTNELARLLQAQAEEIRMFKQGKTLKNPE
jgi:hypothetical protein